MKIAPSIIMIEIFMYASPLLALSSKGGLYMKIVHSKIGIKIFMYATRF